jgi:hypothetical protein
MLTMLIADTWWMPVLDHALQGVGTILGGACIAIAVKVFQKMGLSVTDAQMTLYDTAIYNAINSAEEWAHREAAANAGKVPTGSAKLQQAVNFAMKVIDEYGLDKKAESWVVDRIHSALGGIRSVTMPAA